MAINLSRNTKVYFTTNVNSTTGVVTDALSGFTNTNTFQIPVLDGYSFSQGTEQQTIQVSEAGNTPTRGQRAFNTQLNPVDWSFSTYIRPEVVTSLVSAQEKYLWNALLGSTALDPTGVSVTSITRASTSTGVATIVASAFGTAPVVGDAINISGATAADWNQPARITAIPSANTYTVEFFKAPATASGLTATVATAKAYLGQWAPGANGTGGTYSYTSTLGSNKNQFQKFALIFVVDNVLYCVDNCAMNQASIDFGLDAIATIAWTGQGTVLKQLSTVTAAHLTSNSLAAPAQSSGFFITNKLSSMSLAANIMGGGTSYAIPITGGNVTISNNITYLTPANLAVVNTPITYFSGTRSVSGNVTAYLRTGETNGSGDLLNTLLTNASTSVEPKYRMQLEMGGSTNSVRVEFEMPGVSLQVPTVDVADVVSTTINFNAQAFDTVTTNQAYDLGKTNELMVKYYAP